MAGCKIRDAAGETIPYLAGWSEDGALNAVTQSAELIDPLAHRVEAALSTAGDTGNRRGRIAVWLARSRARTWVRTRSLFPKAGARSAPTRTTECRPERAPGRNRWGRPHPWESGRGVP
jgi:hypothetical protein